LKSEHLRYALLRDTELRDERQYGPFSTQIWSSPTAVQQKTLPALIQEAGCED
jgi:hypothetical protein